MNKFAKMTLVVIVVLLILGIWFYNRISKEVILPTNEKYEILTFSNGVNIHIKAKVWGIAGNHEEIVFSETPKKVPIKESDYIFYTREVFYKVDKNTLTLYAPQSGKSIPKTPFKDVEVIFIGLKKSDEISDYSINHAKYGLQRISVHK